MRDLLIHSGISIRIRKGFIPGGLTGSVPEQRMQGGGSIILRFRMFEGPACGCEDPDRGYGIRPLSDRAGFKIKRRE